MDQLSCIRWNANTGRIHSKNDILVAHERLLVGTCGQHWNVGDAEDGVSCFDAKTGKRIWFTATCSDVNAIGWAGHHVLCPTDRGDIFLLDADHGGIVAQFQMDSAALSKPLVWPADEGGWDTFAISAIGSVYRLTSGAGEIVKIGSLGDAVRADLIDVSSESERAFIAATEAGAVLRCVIEDGKLTSKVLCRVNYPSPYPSAHDDGETRVGGVHAAPAVEGTRLYVGFARETYLPTAPLICINVQSGEEIW